MSFLSGLLKVLGVVGAGVAGGFTGGATWSAIPALVGAGGAALSEGASAAAHNRGSTINTMLASDQDRLNYAQNQRTSESDIMKKLAQTKYLGAGGYQGPAGHLGIAPTAASPTQMEASNTLQSQLIKRLNDPMSPTNVEPYTHAGTGENIMGIGGGLLSTLGAGMQASQQAKKKNLYSVGGVNPLDTNDTGNFGLNNSYPVTG